MADSWGGYPVYQPPDTMSTLSSLMGLKQRKLEMEKTQLGMQGQASENQSLAAKAQGDTQTMQERQRVTQMLSSGKDDQGNDIRGEDGNPDPTKVLPALGRMAPMTGQGYAQNILKTITDHVGLQAASASLDATERSMLMAPVQAAALDPSVKSADVGAGIDNLVKAHPEMANAATYLKGLTAHLDNVPVAKRGQAIQSIAARLQPGQSVQTQPQEASVNTGAQTLSGTTAPPVTGGAFTPTTAVTNTVAPSVQSTPAGLVRVAPGGGSAAIIPSAGPTTPQGLSANPSAAQAAGALGSAQGITERVQQAQAQANTTPQTMDALSRAEKILTSGNAANAGATFDMRKGIKNFLAGVGVDTQGADDTNSLVKNLARYEASRATAAGLGHTDAARDLAHTGSPNVSIDNGALLGIVRQSMATEKALASYANVQSKTSDPSVQAKNEAAFRSIPNVVKGYEYGATKSPQEADAFLKKEGMSKDDMKATRDAIKGFEAQ